MATNNSINNSAQELILPNTTSSSVGVINLNSTSMMHCFGDPSNTYVGQSAGNFTQTPSSASGNTGIGNLALNSITTGVDCTAIGYQARQANLTGSRSIAIGALALKTSTGSPDSIAIGYNCFANGTAGYSQSLGIGSNILNSYTGSALGSQVVFIGYNVAQNWTQVGPTSNTIIGWLAASTGIGTACTGNTCIGASALQSATTAGANTSLGVSGLQNLLTGVRNVTLGFGCGTGYTSSESDNIIIGVNVTGTAGTSNVLRIGAGTGTSQSQLNQAYISGISGRTLSAGSPTPYLTLVDSSNNQLVSPIPTDAATATSTYGQLSVGTALQNTANYPILVNVSLGVTLATGAVILVGVGSTNTPTAQAVTASITVAAITTYGFSFVVPAKFFAQVTTTGTITVGSITTLATQIG